MNTAVLNTQTGNPDGYADLYEQFHPRVLRLCSHLLGSRDDAEDASSEVFARLPRAMGTYNRARPFSSWLSGVTSHYCVDVLRKRRSEQRVFVPADPEWPEPAGAGRSPLEELLLNEERATVREAIARLPERYRSPLVMRYYEDLSCDEIAHKLNLSLANVKTLIFRAKKELRGMLEESETGWPSDPSALSVRYMAG
ncbi:MAG TPA: RNA polymerase sigma factor [Terriglobia bacterium]|nr:RNA polymerase sigma factor [Terriglobia bacterium]